MSVTRNTNQCLVTVKVLLSPRSSYFWGGNPSVPYIQWLGTLSNNNVYVQEVKNGNQKLIFSFFPVLWLDKFAQWEIKQRLSDSLCETKVFHQARHRTSGCYSWCPGRQRFRCLSSLLFRSWWRGGDAYCYFLTQGRACQNLLASL